MRKMHEDNMRHLIENGVPPQMQAIMGEAGQHTNKLLETIRQGLKEAQQPTAPITVRFFGCALVGTPIALINQAGGIDWAASFDPWGNIQQEYNPHGIEQNIRLPGQYHDRETDLYYNRFRYYDRKIGAYINQDPIGLAGGWNLSAYVNGDPLQRIDPVGLEWVLGDTFPRDSSDPNSPLNRQTIYCDDEQPKINTRSSGRCEEALKTVPSHEQSHLDDALKEKPNICKGNKGITQIGNTSTDARLDSERRAHELNLRQLQDALKNPPPGCSKPFLEGSIRVIEESLERIRTRKYPY